MMVAPSVIYIRKKLPICFHGAFGAIMTALEVTSEMTKKMLLNAGALLEITMNFDKGPPAGLIESVNVLIFLGCSSLTTSPPAPGHKFCARFFFSLKCSLGSKNKVKKV